MADVLGSPEFERALQEVSNGLTRGVAEGLTRDDRVAVSASRVVDAVVHTLADRLRVDLAPAAAALVRTAVANALQEAASPEAIASVRRIAAATSESAARAAVAASAQEIEASLAPSMARALTQTLGPAIESVLRDNVARGMAGPNTDSRTWLAASTRVIAREAVLGSNDAMAALEAGKPKKGLLARLAAFFSEAMWVVWILLGLASTLGGWLLLRLQRVRKAALAERRRREFQDAVLLGMATAAEATAGKPWADEFQTALFERMEALKRGERDPKARHVNFQRGA
jgi:hypothetical protein